MLKRMRHRLFPAALVLWVLLANRPAFADPSAPYFTPRLYAGDHIVAIGSTTISLIGNGFAPSVQRYSSSATTTILSVHQGDIRIHTWWHVDGYSVGDDIEHVDAARRERVVNGVLRPDLGANGFSPSYLFGNPPPELVNGTQWKIALAKPAPLAPAIQTVRVAALATDTGTITLARTGQFTGPLGLDKRGATIVVGGVNVHVRVLARGPARWSGYTTLVRGITVADALLMERDVDLVTPDGIAYHAHERLMTTQNAVPGNGWRLGT